jgi:hypothetical protein
MLKHGPADPNGARVFADLDPKFDGLSVERSDSHFLGT